MGANKKIGISKLERTTIDRYCKRFSLFDYEIEISRASGKRILYVIGIDENDLEYRIRYDKVALMKKPKGVQITNKKKYLIHQADEVHGKDKYILDHIKEEDINFKNKLHIICRTHGVFLKRKAAFITQKEGCPKCSQNRLNNNRKYFKKDGLRKK